MFKDCAPFAGRGVTGSTVFFGFEAVAARRVGATLVVVAALPFPLLILAALFGEVFTGDDFFALGLSSEGIVLMKNDFKILHASSE